MTTLVEKLTALAAREYEAATPKLDNCATHGAKNILERDIDCSMCGADMREMVKAALAANKWLYEWQEETQGLIAQLTAEPAIASEPDAALDPNAISDEEMRELNRQSVLPVIYDDGTKVTVGTMAGGAADTEAHMMDGPLTLSLDIEHDGKGHPVDYLRCSTFTPALLTKIADLVRSALVVDDHEVREQVEPAEVAVTGAIEA